MQRLEVSGAVRPIYGSLGVKRLTFRPASAAKALAYAKIYMWHYPARKCRNTAFKTPQIRGPYFIRQTQPRRA